MILELRTLDIPRRSLPLVFVNRRTYFCEVKIRIFERNEMVIFLCV